MGAVASQITSLTIVYSTFYLDADQRKHQNSASPPFVRGIHRGPVNSPHKWPVTRKMFPFDDVIMVYGSIIQTAVQQVVLWRVIYQYPTLQGSNIHTKTKRPNIARDIILAAILRFNLYLITISSAAKYKHSLFINVQQLVMVEHMTTLLLLTICYWPPVANVALQSLLWVSTKLKYHLFSSEWNGNGTTRIGHTPTQHTI